MAEAPPEAPGPPVSGPLDDLPAGYQQVMSPSGDAARETGPHRPEEQMPNGVSRQARSVSAVEPDYSQAFGFSGQGTASDPGQGTTRERTLPDMTTGPSGSGDAAGMVGGAGQQDDQSGRRMARTGVEFFRSFGGGERARNDPPILPHAREQGAVGPGSRDELMLPSPLPSPARSVTGDEPASLNAGNVIVQQGAAAMKWFAKLGEFVQRRVSQQTRPGEQMTVVQETVWSPGRGHQREAEPLFDRSQSQRLREMTMAAPQLYGAVPPPGGGSDSSRSFTREQLESEVKKQVDQAMEQQRVVNHENEMLKREVERLKAQAIAAERERMTAQASVHPSTVPRDPRLPLQAEQMSGALEGNLAGLPGHGREQGGELQIQGVRGHELRGNPEGLWVHDSGQGGDRVLSSCGVSQSNPPGLLGPGPRHAVQGDVLPQDASVPGGIHGGLQGQDDRGAVGSIDHGALGGNLSGLPGHGREQGGSVRARSLSPRRTSILGVSNRFGGSEGNAGVEQEAPMRSNQQAANLGSQSLRDYVVGGNLAGLPGHGREQGGRNLFDEPGIYSGPNDNAPGIYSGPPPGLSGERRGNAAAPGGSGQANREALSGANSNPLEALVQGMTQLQQAMAMQLDISSTKPEAIRPGTSADQLPKLCEADEMAAINVGDWLHGLSGPMGDLTDGSAQWWGQVLQSLNAYYTEYIHAQAVKKLHLKPDDFAAPMLKETRWLRVDKRAASMLLQAIPDNIRAEVLANRLQTTLAILARILTIYRPGSSAERQQVLKALEQPGVANSPMDLVDSLRKWARWLKRAQDLGLQVPDPSILLRGIDQEATRLQLEKHNEVAFRANMLRYSLELDSTPSLTPVVKLQTHLLGEFEQIAYRGRARSTTTTTTPTVKAMGAGAADGGHAASPKGTVRPRLPEEERRNHASFSCPSRDVSEGIASSPMIGLVFLEKNGVNVARTVVQRGI